MLCVIYKLLISRNIDLGVSQGGLLGRHLDKCQGCKSYRDTSISIDSQLKQGTVESVKLDTSRLEQKIMDSLPSRRYKQAGSLFKPARIVAMAACLLIAVMVVFHTHQARKQAQIAHAVEFFDSIERFKSRTGQSRLASIRGVFQDPMAGELQNISADASNAANFLISCVNPPSFPDQK